MRGFKSPTIFSILRSTRPSIVNLARSRGFLIQSSENGSSSCGTSRCLFSSLGETISEYENNLSLNDETVAKKDAALHLALSHLAGEFDEDSKLSLGHFCSTRPAQVIPTGSLKLDQALGVGGLPKGRMVEIYGREASGKTTVALHIVREAQRLGGCCAYIDAENAMDPCLAETIGVNTNDLLIAHPNSAENSLSIVNILAGSGSVDVIVVDSVAALVPQCELDGVSSRDMQPKIMTQALRRIHYSVTRSQTLVIFVNQVRMHPKGDQGSGQMEEVTCGGNALKFYSAIRLRLSRNCLTYNENEVTGISISAHVVKNNLAPARKNATLDIEFGRGIRFEAELLELATLHGIIMREGNGYWIKNTFLQDQREARQYIRENCEVSAELLGIIRNQLFGAVS